MTKGTYPAADHTGKIVGHYIPVGGPNDGWAYRPLPKPVEWIVLDDAAAKAKESHDA